MGLLRHPLTERTFTLAARTVVGRSPACTLVLADGRASSEHAVVAWNGQTWTVRDLGSRNHTLVDDHALPAGQEARLIFGSRLRFGGDLWVLADDAPPVAQAVCLDDDRRITATGTVLLLPDADQPLVSVVSVDGAWRVEGDTASRPVADHDIIEVGGRSFRLHLPTTWAATLPADSVTSLHFRVSSDEEHVEVTVQGGGRTTRLRPRAHQYTLLILARRRLADLALSPEDRGWLSRDDLARLLRIDPITVNVQLHRIRQDLGQHGDSAAALLQIRAGTGQVRLGADALTVQGTDR
jgi:hypothetical protein